MFYVYADGESIFNPIDSGMSIVSPKVTLELGKSGSFQFGIPQSNEFYNYLEQINTKIVVELDNTEIFRGRVLSISRGFNNLKVVYCEGILSYLVDSVQKARRYNGSAKKLYETILKRHNAMVEPEKRFNVSLGSFGVEDTTVVIPGKKEDGDAYYGENKYEQAIIESLVDEWKTTYDYINSIFLDYLGGYLIAKYDRNRYVNYIDYISNEEFDSRIEEAETRNVVDHEIEFGINMIDFSEEVNAEDIFTVLIPLGDGEEDVLTIAGATNKYSDSSIELVNIDGKPIGIADKRSRERYGTIVKTYSFENVNNANTLFSNAVKYLKLHKNIPTTYEIKAVDLHFVNKTNSQIEIGDTVKITSPIHGINRYLLCTRIEYDLVNPANTTYTFGNPKQTLTERYKRNKDKDRKDREHDSKRAAKGGGGAAGSAKDDAVDAAQGIVDDLYDAYIKVDDAAGKITMATLYHDIVNGKKQLKAMAGIDLDAGPDAAKVNIYTMYDDIGKANTRITQVSDALHAEIELASQYSKGVNEALNTFKQYATDTYATQEMLSTFKTEASEALAGFKTEVSTTYATVKAFTEFTTAETKARAGLEAWATKEFAKVLTKAEYEAKATAARTSIEQWASKKFASINIMSEYKTSKGRTLAQIEQYVDENTSKIGLTSSTVTSQGNAIAGITLLTNKLESVIKQTTNYNNLKWDKNGNITGSVSAAGTTITSDALKASIESFTGFGKFIDGKLLNSTTSIKQTADDSKAEVELLAKFDGKGTGLKITAFKDVLTNHIKTQIDLKADDIKVDAQKMTINALLNQEGVATFSRNVFANGGISGGGNISMQGNVSGANLAADGYITATGSITSKIGMYVDGKAVALKQDIPDVSGFPSTQNDVVNLLRGTYTTAQWITNQLNSKYTNWNTYIKDKVEAIIDANYIKAKLKAGYNSFEDYIGAIAKSAITETYIKEKMGCKDGSKTCSLSTYISNHSAKAHSHTVSIGHTHKYTDAKGNSVNTLGASNSKFTTSSNS